MLSPFLETGIILYGFVQAVIAFFAVILAVKWKKSEFLAGLSFLFVYSIVELIDTFFFTILNSVFIDVAQFGFILLAIIFFIIGMHPSWSPRLAPCLRERTNEDKPAKQESVLSILRKS